MNRRDLLKGAVAVAGASMVPATVAIADPVSVSDNFFVVFYKNKMGSFICRKNNNGQYSSVYSEAKIDNQLIEKVEDFEIYIKRITSNFMNETIKVDENSKENTQYWNKAKELFDKEPHNHPRGQIPFWNRQPQFIKDVFIKRAKGY